MAKLVTADVIAGLKEMTILEINELVEAIEEEFGVTAAAPVAVVAGGDVAASDDEPKEVNVVITDIGQSKIQVIKAVNEITGAGLKGAKEIVEAAPEGVVKENVPTEEAEEIKAKLVEAGASVEFK
ncbi:MAG: 50S ribosomal protein L7/L12 [Erysipelothrix sp.]|nr:50S ribosomal protein L7/L12 [Erysipelothrix sp.]